MECISRYIQYEITLEKLIRMRLAKFDNSAASRRARRVRHYCTRHIHFIFDRAVKKFKADINLWLEWAAFAKTASSSNVLSKIFARALQVNNPYSYDYGSR